MFESFDVLFFMYAPNVLGFSVNTNPLFIILKKKSLCIQAVHTFCYKDWRKMIYYRITLRSK